MRIENTDPVTEMLNEVKVLRFLLKKRHIQLLQQNPALAMLRMKDRLDYLYDDDKDFRSIINAITQINGLIEEELDALIPVNIMWAELTSN